jgi:hypothetical protein
MSVRVEDWQRHNLSKTWQASGKYGDYYSVVVDNTHSLHTIKLVGDIDDYWDLIRGIDWQTMKLQAFPNDTEEGTEYMIDGYIVGWRARQNNTLFEATIQVMDADEVYIERLEASAVPPAFSDISWAGENTIMLKWIPYPEISYYWSFELGHANPWVYLSINPNGWIVEFAWVDQMNVPASSLSEVIETGSMILNGKDGSQWLLALKDYSQDTQLRINNMSIYQVRAYISKVV